MLQITTLILLLLSIGIKRMRKLALHGVTMLGAVILNFSSFVLIMLPSLLRTEIIRTQPAHTVSIATLVHSSIGLIALILGVWLVASWHLRSSFADCFRNKRLMRLTTVLWLIALMIGFLLYYILYAY